MKDNEVQVMLDLGIAQFIKNACKACRHRPRYGRQCNSCRTTP